MNNVIEIEKIRRGCGDGRTPGGIYGIVATSPLGRPLEDFLFCHPRPLPEGIALSNVGQTFVVARWQNNDVGLIFDWIGSEHYPNVADFLEEARAHGISRRMAPNVALQASRMPRNFIIPVHARAVVRNWASCRSRRWECPRQVNKHPVLDNDEYEDWLIDFLFAKGEGVSDEMCSGLWWETVEGGERIDDDGSVRRQIGQTTYYAMAQNGGWRGEFDPACLGRFPLSHFEVMAGSEESPVTYKTLDGGQTPVYMAVER